VALSWRWLASVRRLWGAVLEHSVAPYQFAPLLHAFRYAHLNAFEIAMQRLAEDYDVLRHSVRCCCGGHVWQLGTMPDTFTC